ncbi:S-layer homology domain-containing protein [Patescibacteria group bacterium]|nr:S-layer homology domain-containing protein [Patescibacteria group bacterium]MBU1758441.1 S-layer homology domain-containing protein [Patescibacteria group bacterium]
MLDVESIQKSNLTVPVTTKMIDQIFKNIQDQFPGMTQSPDLRVSDLYVKRGPAARYVVQGFDLAPQGDDFENFDGQQELYFTDINGHQYSNDIKILAQLGIVNTQNKRFYPDNYLQNYEFTVLLVNTILSTQNQSLDLNYRGNRQVTFTDVDAKASYLPRVNYAENKNLISYLTVNKRGQNFFAPNKEISKHEIYHILGELTDFAMDYDQSKADQQRMTRGQFASVLVDAFQLKAPDVTVVQSNQAQDSDESSSGNLSLLLQIRSLLSKLE